MATATLSTDQRDAVAYITNLLRTYGLESLVGWALGQVQHGQSENEIVQSMRTTPEFQQRFPAIVERERKGLPSISPSEYVTYENQATQLMRAHGLPVGFYDQPSDFSNLIAGDVSVDELNRRVQQGYDRVMTLPGEVRSAFRDYYGVNGDSALAAYFLDPDKAAPMLLQQAGAAAIGGTGTRYGFTIGRDIAEIAAQTGLTDTAAAANLAALAQQAALFDETVSESDNLDKNREGVQAALGLDGDASAAVRRRLAERGAKFQGNESTFSDQRGAAGLGSANRR